MAKVLVVDHERRIRKWITDSLGKCGYDVEEAADGQTALETVSRRRFDLILLDDALPKNGWLAGADQAKRRPTDAKDTRRCPDFLSRRLKPSRPGSVCVRPMSYPSRATPRPWRQP